MSKEAELTAEMLHIVQPPTEECKEDFARTGQKLNKLQGKLSQQARNGQESTEAVAERLAAAREENRREQEEGTHAEKLKEVQDKVDTLVEELLSLQGRTRQPGEDDVDAFGDEEPELGKDPTVLSLSSSVQDTELSVEQQAAQLQSKRDTNAGLQAYTSAVRLGDKNEMPVDLEAFNIVTCLREDLKANRMGEIIEARLSLAISKPDTSIEDNERADLCRARRTELAVELKVLEEECEGLTGSRNLLRQSFFHAAVLSTREVKSLETEVQELQQKAVKIDSALTAREVLRRQLRDTCQDLDRLLDQACANLAQEHLEVDIAPAELHAPAAWVQHLEKKWDVARRQPRLLKRLQNACEGPQEGTELTPSRRQSLAPGAVVTTSRQSLAPGAVVTPSRRQSFSRGLDGETSAAVIYEPVAFNTSGTRVMRKMPVVAKLNKALDDTKQRRTETANQVLWAHLGAIEAALGPPGTWVPPNAGEVINGEGAASARALLGSAVGALDQERRASRAGIEAMGRLDAAAAHASGLRAAQGRAATRDGEVAGKLDGIFASNERRIAAIRAARVSGN